MLLVHDSLQVADANGCVQLTCTTLDAICVLLLWRNAPALLSLVDTGANYGQR